MTLRPPDCLTAASAGKILAKSFPVEKLLAATAGFLIDGESLAYRLDSTWKLINRRRRRTAAVPGSRVESALFLLCIVYHSIFCSVMYLAATVLVLRFFHT